MPQRKGIAAICGTRTKVAQQARSVAFKLDLMPTYDEKVDIWKIPPVVNRILGEVNGSIFVKRKLRKMMERCQAINPKKRPTASEVLLELLRVEQLIQYQSITVRNPL